MSDPFSQAEAAFEAAQTAHNLVPSTPVETMPTSALIAEMVSYLTESKGRDKLLLFGYGHMDVIGKIKIRRNAVCAEIDARIPRRG